MRSNYVQTDSGRREVDWKELRLFGFGEYFKLRQAC
jgi:hypothetical protein